jgi:two-component system, repressor protein LuxO
VSLNMLPLLLRETSTPLNPSPVAAPETLVSAPVNNDSSIRPLAVVERDAILQAIAACRGNIPQASRLLEVSPSTLYRKLQGWQEQGLLPDNHK